MSLPATNPGQNEDDRWRRSSMRFPAWCATDEQREQYYTDRCDELRAEEEEDVRLHLASMRQCRPSAYYWADQMEHLAEVPEAELRLHLREPHIQLALLLGSLCGNSAKKRRLSYSRLAVQLGMTKRRVARHLKRLVDLGLYSLVFQRRRRPDLEDLADPTNIYRTEQVWVWPRASVRRYKGQLRVWAPLQLWKSKTETIRTWGGRRAGAGRPRLGNQDGNPPVSGAENAEAKCAKLGGPVDEEKNQDGGLYIYRDLSSLDSSGNTMYSQRTAQEPSTRGNKEKPDPALSPFDQLTSLASTPNPTRSTSLPPLRLCPIDSPERVQLTPLDEFETVSDADIPMESRVNTVLSSYRRAYQDVHGSRCGAFLRGDVTLSKHFPRLAQAVLVMVEHGVSPYHWARWRLEHAKEEGKKPLGPTQIYAAATILRLRGFFRRSYDVDRIKTVIARENREQLFRNDESARRSRGVSHLHGYPGWYVDMRRAEVADGDDDPLALYPRYKADKKLWYRPGSPPWRSR